MFRDESSRMVTTSGNRLDLFFVAMQLRLHLLFRLSVLTLRIPAAISGLLAVLILFRPGRRYLDRESATLSAIPLATLPIAIIFSRHGLEYSQTPLVGSIAAFAAWRGRGRGHSWRRTRGCP